MSEKILCEICGDDERWCYCLEEKVEKMFEECDDEFLKDDRIPDSEKPTGRSDLNAFLKLDQLVPGTGDMVDAAEHDEIFLDTSVKDLAKVATLDDIRYLVRCGVRYSEHGLCMSA